MRLTLTRFLACPQCGHQVGFQVVTRGIWRWIWWRTVPMFRVQNRNADALEVVREWARQYEGKPEKIELLLLCEAIIGDLEVKGYQCL